MKKQTGLYIAMICVTILGIISAASEGEGSVTIKGSYGKGKGMIRMSPGGQGHAQIGSPSRPSRSRAA